MRRNERGFTLIELMIVIAIIGILAAIAIPQFAKYRTKAYNAAAESDLRNIMTAEEAAYADMQTYAKFAASSGPGPVTNPQGYVNGKLQAVNMDAKLSKNVGAVANINASGTAYAAFTGHKNGDRVYGGDSTGKIAWTNPAASKTPDTTATSQTATSVPSTWKTL